MGRRGKRKRSTHDLDENPIDVMVSDANPTRMVFLCFDASPTRGGGKHARMADLVKEEYYDPFEKFDKKRSSGNREEYYDPFEKFDKKRSSGNREEYYDPFEKFDKKRSSGNREEYYDPFEKFDKKRSSGNREEYYDPFEKFDKKRSSGNREEYYDPFEKFDKKRSSGNREEYYDPFEKLIKEFQEIGKNIMTLLRSLIRRGLQENGKNIMTLLRSLIKGGEREEYYDPFEKFDNKSSFEKFDKRRYVQSCHPQVRKTNVLCVTTGKALETTFYNTNRVKGSSKSDTEIIDNSTSRGVSKDQRVGSTSSQTVNNLEGGSNSFQRRRRSSDGGWFRFKHIIRFYEVEQALKERERHPINQRVKHPLEPVLDPDLYKKIQVSVTLESEISLQADRGNGVMCLTMSCKAVQEGAGSSKPVDGNDLLDQPVPTESIKY
ncbi:hypothetical protein Tco_1262643 [Tanacetum coccineum]